RGTDKILVLNASGEHRVPSARRYRQTALAHRTRLSGTQTGGWARPLRRARLARLPPSRNAVHRGLWIPDLRAGDDSPLRNAFHRVVQRNYNSRSLPPKGGPPLRPERHVPNSIATIRRRLSAALVAMLSRCPCCVATISAQSRRQKF